MFNTALKQQIAQSHHISEITKPLEASGIIGFFYTRIYRDNSFINLATSASWSEYYFQKLYDGLYHPKDTARNIFMTPGVTLWTLNPENTIWQDAQNEFGYGNGISICEENNAFRETTGFYSNIENRSINHDYLNQLDALKKFKNYFTEKAEKIILESETQKCFLPENTKYHHPTTPIIFPQVSTLEFDWNNIFQLSIEQINTLLTKRSYPVLINTRQASLSKMEIITLIQLLKGLHAGEIAASLKLSQNTIESYLFNIKNKVNVKLKSELVQKVIDTQLLQQIKISQPYNCDISTI